MPGTWLDAQTRSLLQERPPPRGPATAAGEFSIVLLARGPDPARMEHAAGVVAGDDYIRAQMVESDPLPLVCCAGLTLEDAMLAQFELVCCDAVAVFVRDEVVHGAEREYLDEIYLRVRASDEFAPQRVHLGAVPDTDEGRSFLRQFLGRTDVRLPFRATVTMKKARVMSHWADQVGADLAVGDRD